MQSSAIVLYSSKKNAKNIIIFNRNHGKVDVINKSGVSFLCNGALIQCRLESHGSKRYLQESALEMIRLPSTYSDLLFVHSLLELVRHTHLYEHACAQSFDVLKAVLAKPESSLSIPQKVLITAKLVLLGAMISDEDNLTKNSVDYLIYTAAEDILKETTNDIDCVGLAQWIWSCLATHPHKDKLHVIFQQIHIFKEYFLL